MGVPRTGVLDLAAQEQHDRFQALLAAVDIITKEEVVRLRREAAELEHPEQIWVLSVHACTIWSNAAVQPCTRLSDTQSGVLCGANAVQRACETAETKVQHWWGRRLLAARATGGHTCWS